MNRKINISGPMLMTLLALIVGFIFLFYLGYDWFSGLNLDPDSQNTEEAGNAFKGTAFVLGLLLILLYKIRRNEKIAEIQQNTSAMSPEKINSVNNSPTNIAANLIIVATAIFFGIGFLIILFYSLLFMNAN